MKKVLFFSIIIILIFLINFMFINKAYARIETGSVDISDSTKSDFQDAGNRVLGVIRVVVIFISVAGAMILGIKYMMGSVEEKAQNQHAFVLYVIGAILAFGIIGIVEVAYKAIENIF